jgi:urease accessory protein
MQLAVKDTEMQRSHGRATVGFALQSGTTRLRDLHQHGSAKALMPRRFDGAAEVVFLNTSGGITDGDSLAYDIALGAGAKVTATTQTAERAYASRSAAGHATVTAQVGAAARLDWLPQETILFENCHLQRDTTIDLAADASCLLCESVVLGRHAMGEEPKDARLTDRRLIRREGRPVWAETVQIDAEFLAHESPALLGQARAYAVIALVSANATDALSALRAVLDEPGTRTAASSWDGKCVLRILARDSWPMKKQIAKALGVLGAAPPPRVWQM